ncbi:MAG: AAA family ATPase [Marinomonas sp.]
MRFWKAFGFNTNVDPETETVIGTIPDNTVAIVARGSDQIDAKTRALQLIGIIPGLWGKTSPSDDVTLYALDAAAPLSAIKNHFESICSVFGPGDPIRLPSGQYFEPKGWAQSASDLSVLDSLQKGGAQQVPPAEDGDDQLPSIVENSPLAEFSLFGKGAELEMQAKDHTGLLGRAILSGQATVVYAPPNAGKTLIALHLLSEGVMSGKIRAQNVYYVNADDSGRGVAEKVVLLDELEANTLVPGMLNFTTAKLSEAMQKMVEDDQCNGVVIIVDTLKKFVDLMDKRQSAGFGNMVRQFVMKGGTFVALAHTRKNGAPDGALIYGGTSDVMEDFDAACLLVPLPERSPRGEKVVQFQFTKRRGPNDDSGYAYDDAKELSYSQRLASVRPVEPEDLDEFAAAELHRADEDIIAAIHGCLADGIQQKMAIRNDAAARCGASRRAVITVLERYTGDDPSEHHWRYSIQERGAKVYFAHEDCP